VLARRVLALRVSIKLARTSRLTLNGLTAQFNADNDYTQNETAQLMVKLVPAVKTHPINSARYGGS
jgi:hypothetical protein